MYYYKGFSLNITSSLELPQLYAVERFSSEKADLFIQKGTVPNELLGTDVTQKVNTWSRVNEYLLNVPNIAAYYVKNGNLITIQPALNCDWDSIRLFLLDTIIPAALHQRNLLPLNASAIRYKEGLILFCGHSNTGKTTTAAFFEKRGYPIFSDDICTIIPSISKNNSILAHAAYPNLKMWSTTVELLKDNQYNKKYSIRKGIDKYWNSLKSDFSLNPLPVYKIFFLRLKENTNGFVADKLTLRHSIYYLNRHIMKVRQLDGLDKKMDSFKMLGTIVHQIPTISVYRSEYNTDIEAYLDFLEHEF